MGKAKVVAGKDLMIFVDGEPTALATSHSISITAETSEAASKDDGAWGAATVTKFSWEGSLFYGYKEDQSGTFYIY